MGKFVTNQTWCKMKSEASDLGRLKCIWADTVDTETDVFYLFIAILQHCVFNGVKMERSQTHD